MIIIAILSFILGAGIGFFLMASLKIEKENEDGESKKNSKIHR